MSQALQDLYAPRNICFGCGPANPDGLHIKSFVEGDQVVCRWTARPHHQAFDGVVNGGILGTLVDCHSNWTATHHLMRTNGLDKPPCTVTAEFSVSLKRPTPSDREVVVRAWVVESSADRAVVESVIESDGTVTATGRGVFVAVKEGHPAFHRW